MMDAVPTADVVITNPTTLAVALKYDSLTMKAPRIVAKGQRLMAERIKEIARKNRVPIVEDKPLARALFSRPVGADVPSHLYRAVARLLVLVHQARFGMRRRSWAGRDTRGATAQPAWAMASAAPAAPSERGGWEESDLGGRVSTDEELGARYGQILNEDGEPIDVDEEALGRALEEDDLGDLSADELDRLENGEDLPTEEDLQATEAEAAAAGTGNDNVIEGQATGVDVERPGSGLDGDEESER